MVALLPSKPATRRRMTASSKSTTTWLAFLLPLIGAVSAQTATDVLPARWGQASALVGSLLVVQGGKTQGTTGGGYTYGSAPSDGEMYVLDLSSGFPLSSPPWQAVSVGEAGLAAPAVAFHTITPLNSTSLLLFGGDASPVVPVQTRNDSAYIVHLGGSAANRTVIYQTVPTTWSQPMRRIYHTSESNGRGQVYIVGGERADGSGIALDEQWNIDTTTSSPTFQLASPSPPGSLVGSTSTMLSDGTLLLLGGVDPSGQLQTMQNLYAYSSKSKTWSQTTTTTASNQTLAARQANANSAAFPAPRRDHIAVSLPNQRVFIQGGASADLSTVYSDAWILDWSVNPPVWTMIEATGGPGERYGHSAVAYGREVLISFGWSGGNAAPTGLYVFDATKLVASASSQGSWTGGSWSTTTYTPDPEATRPATPSTNSGSSSGSSSNGSSSSSGGSSTPSTGSDSGSDGSDSGMSPGSFPTNTGTTGDDGSAHTDGTSNGAKAGAAIGAIVGVGLVVGAGYAVYRRRSLNNYRRYGDGSVGLLGFGGRRNGGMGGEDDDYLMEKGEYDRPYHRTDGGGAHLTGGLVYGRKRGRSEGAAWTAGNVGHAMEGSGPHFRERIAILAGRGKRDALAAPRVDMLADEGDGNSLFRPHHPEDLSHLYDNEEDDLDSPRWSDRQLREHSYAQVGEEDLSSGDLGRLPEDDHNQALEEHHMYSPFEDRPEDSRVGGIALMSNSAHGYGKLADREVDVCEQHSDDGRSDFDSGPSVQSHSTASKSDVPSSSKSYDVLSAGGIVSFSDASHGRRSGQGMMKRSPTWWDRFMGNSILERTASGRFLTGPNANLPIRDPAPPPVSGLEAITESPRSRDVSEAYPAQDPFADSSQPQLDEMGRPLPTQGEEGYPSHSQGRSLSSIGSARTNASSHFESRLRGMDVIQRVRTGSSRRTQSTTRTGSTMSDTDSEPALSRGPTLLRPRNVVSSEALGEDETPGSVVWKPEDWSQTPGGGGGLEDLQEEQTEDLTSSTHLEVETSPPSWSRANARKSNVSETPSITPLTTKRARLNPVMVSPLFPSANARLTAPSPTVAAPSASVRDKVKAFESQSAAVPESAWTASLSSAKSARTFTQDTETGDTSAEVAAEGIERAISPSSTAASSRRGGGGKKAKYYTHGLVPKAQLFVANPDHGRGGSGSDS